MEGADRTGEDDGAGSLDVIYKGGWSDSHVVSCERDGRTKKGSFTVEARVDVAILLQEGESERGVEVLELDDLRSDAKSV